ncbi:MAG: proteasome subunit alpha [Candidatus Poribacteria bacterium]|nr:proteasome subunit alpha [Candidatus Poribacteria bacterium]
MPSPFMVSPEQIMQEKDELARKGIQLGREVVALEYDDGIVFIAENASATLRKVSEIYDRIAFAGVGNYQEYDPLRTAGIEQAEIKGFTYSREDVTARWMANLYSQTIGNVWRQFDTKPLEIELIIAEIGETGFSTNRLYRISYSGSLIDDQQYSVIGGKYEDIRKWLKDHYEAELSLDAAVRLAVNALRDVRKDQDDAPEVNADRLEIALLDGSRNRRKFRRLTKDEIAAMLDG